MGDGNRHGGPPVNIRNDARSSSESAFCVSKPEHLRRSKNLIARHRSAHERRSLSRVQQNGSDRRPWPFCARRSRSNSLLLLQGQVPNAHCRTSKPQPVMVVPPSCSSHGQTHSADQRLGLAVLRHDRPSSHGETRALWYLIGLSCRHCTVSLAR